MEAPALTVLFKTAQSNRSPACRAWQFSHLYGIFGIRSFSGMIALQAGTGTIVLPSGLIPLVFIVLGMVVTYFIFWKLLVALDDLVVAGYLKDVPGWKCGFRDYNTY